MARYDQLNCTDCGDHIGWLTDCGPRGMAYCDSCKEAEEERERRIEEEDELYSGN